MRHSFSRGTYEYSGFFGGHFYILFGLVHIRLPSHFSIRPFLDLGNLPKCIIGVSHRVGTISVERVMKARSDRQGKKQ